MFGAHSSPCTYTNVLLELIMYTNVKASQILWGYGAHSLPCTTRNLIACIIITSVATRPEECSAEMFEVLQGISLDAWWDNRRYYYVYHSCTATVCYSCTVLHHSQPERCSTFSSLTITRVVVCMSQRLLWSYGAATSNKLLDFEDNISR